MEAGNGPGVREGNCGEGEWRGEGNGGRSECMRERSDDTDREELTEEWREGHGKVEVQGWERGVGGEGKKGLGERKGWTGQEKSSSGCVKRVNHGRVVDCRERQTGGWEEGLDSGERVGSRGNRGWIQGGVEGEAWRGEAMRRGRHGG